MSQDNKEEDGSNKAIEKTVESSKVNAAASSETVTKKEPSPDKSTEKKAVKAVNKNNKRSASKIGGLLVFLAIVLAISVGSYWGWQQFSAFKQSIYEEMDVHQQRLEQQQAGQLASNMDVARNQQQRVERSLAQMAKQQNQLKESVQALYDELNRGRHHGWVIAESQYLINIANHRLYLSRDVDGAIAALKAADQRLRAVGAPSLLTARSALADEISRLQSVPKVDVAGHSAQLVSLQNRVDDLALLTPASIQDEPSRQVDENGNATHEESALRSAGMKFIDSLKDLVKIRRKEGKEIQFLPPEQSSYLRHNIRLKLEVARLALLQQDHALFHASLSVLDDWVSRYFQKDAVYTAMLVQLRELNELNLNIQYPNISASRKALQQWVAAQNNPVPIAVPSNSNVEEGQ